MESLKFRSFDRWKKKDIVNIILIILGPFIFLWFFFFIKTDRDILFSSLTAGCSLISIILIFFFPNLLFIPILYHRKNKCIKKRFENCTHTLNFAVIICLSFLYTIISTILSQYITLYNIRGSLFLFLFFPGIIGVLNYKLIYDFFKLCINFFFMNYKITLMLTIVLFLSLFMRFPYFVPGEIGNDTFLHNVLANLFLETGKIGYLISPLSVFEFFPDSKIPSSIIYITNVSLISRIPSYEAVFLISVFSGVFSNLTFYFLLISYPLKNILSGRSKKLSMILYLTLPLLLKFTDWFVSGRTIFFMMLPFFIIIFLNLIFNENLNFFKKLLLFSTLFFTSILTHGMGRIFFLYVFLTSFINFFYKKLKGKIPIQKYSNLFKFFLLFLGIMFLIFPYFLFASGDSSLMNWWMLNRTGLISSFEERTPFNLIFGFFFIFTARMGFASIFFIIGMLFIPILEIKKKRIYILMISLFIFFLFFAHSMYFYQSLSLIILIMGCIFFDSFLVSIKKYIFKRKKSENSSYKITQYKIIGIFLLGNILIAGIIQYYRSIGEGHPISRDKIEISQYLDSKIKNRKKTSIICSNSKLSIRISAYSGIISFPMEPSVFLSAFPEQKVKIEYHKMSLDSLDVKELIEIFRKGFYDSNSEKIMENMNSIFYPDYINEENFNEFLNLSYIYNVEYLICNESDDWILLEYLIENNYIELIKKIGEIEIYNLQFLNQ